MIAIDEERFAVEAYVISVDGRAGWAGCTSAVTRAAADRIKADLDLIYPTRPHRVVRLAPDGTVAAVLLA